MKSVIDEYIDGAAKKTKKQNSDWYKQYYDKNREKIAKRHRQYYAKRKADGTVGKRLTDGINYQYKWKRKEGYYKELYRKNRQLCLDAYGGKCACCGEYHYEFLAIDHINNDGKTHRAEMAKGTPSGKHGGDTIYRWLKRNKFPDGFQVLCHNCNLAKAFYGECPHKKDKFVANG